ncbi:unnamed protein product [Hapterophycus canaliculatus]
MELRFDLEARTAETARLRRRARELQSAMRSQAAGAGGGTKDAAGSRPAGGRFKRERDLEGVVDALKRVTDKLRGENERLRRVAGEGGGRAEAERRARESKKKVAVLQEEVEKLTARAKEADSAVQKLAQKQDLINQLRRKLKARDEDLLSFQERAEDLAETKTLLSAELEAANQRLLASDREYRPSSRPQAVAATRTAKEVEDAQRVAETLRQQRMERRSAMSGGRVNHFIASDGDAVLGKTTTDLMLSDGGDHEQEIRLEQENRRLKEENDKLSTELQAFDLDFFEEIEDLKYKYSEAVRKLRQYEE